MWAKPTHNIIPIKLKIKESSMTFENGTYTPGAVIKSAMKNIATPTGTYFLGGG